MFNFIKSFFNPTTEVNTMATVGPFENRFAIFDRQGFVVKTYSRKRDAIRGAERMGITVA